MILLDDLMRSLPALLSYEPVKIKLTSSFQFLPDMGTEFPVCPTRGLVTGFQSRSPNGATHPLATEQIATLSRSFPRGWKELASKLILPPMVVLVEAERGQHTCHTSEANANTVHHIYLPMSQPTRREEKEKTLWTVKAECNPNNQQHRVL